MQEKGNLFAVGSCELSKQSGAARLSARTALPRLLPAPALSAGVRLCVCARVCTRRALFADGALASQLPSVGGERGPEGPVRLPGDGAAGLSPALPTSQGSASLPQPLSSAPWSVAEGPSSQRCKCCPLTAC